MLNIRRIRTNIGVALFAAVAVVGLVSGQANAQSVNNSTNVLKVSPVRSDIAVKPGESKTIEMAVTNLTDQPISVKPIQNDFAAVDERGNPGLILDEKQYAPTHSLKRYMQPLENMTIAPKEEKKVQVVISVPKDAPAGGYFGAIRFAPTSSEGDSQVNLSASVASLILMTVPGNLTEKLNLTDFSIQQGTKTASVFSGSNDLGATFRFENKGNVHVAPFGKISVKQGDKVLYEADFNKETPRGMILPDSARRWDMPLKNIGSFGKYTVVATLSYGQTNKTIEVTKSFWVIPQGVIIGTIIAVLVIIGLIVGIWLFLRNYKRRLLKNHGHGNHHK